MARLMWIGLLTGSLAAHAGCAMCQRPQNNGSCPPPPPSGGFVVPPAPVPIARPQPNPVYYAPGGYPGLPPGAVMTPPPGANIVQPGQVPIAKPSFVQENPQEPPVFAKSPPVAPPARVETQWQPTEGREPAPPRVESSRDAPRYQLYAPEPVEKEKAKDSFYLGPPQIDKDKKSAEEPPRIEMDRKPSEETPQLKKPSAQANFPAIPQFAVFKDNVYAGLRAPLDGLDWLQANGVQTVVRVRLFGEDDSADRKQVEKRNMRYVAFEVSPQTLSKAKVDEFIKLVRDGSKSGIFIYDEDGSLAGAMWYLYLRQGEFMDDDAAQLRSRPLGLQQNRDGAHRDMWLAVQKLLSEKR